MLEWPKKRNKIRLNRLWQRKKARRMLRSSTEFTPPSFLKLKILQLTFLTRSALQWSAWMLIRLRSMEKETPCKSTQLTVSPRRISKKNWLKTTCSVSIPWTNARQEQRMPGYIAAMEGPTSTSTVILLFNKKERYLWRRWCTVFAIFSMASTSFLDAKMDTSWNLGD